MKVSVLACALVVHSFAYGSPATNDTALSIADLRTTSRADMQRFDIRGLVVCNIDTGAGSFVIKDKSGSMSFTNESGMPITPGDTVRITGTADVDWTHKLKTHVTHIEALGHGPAPRAVPATVSDIFKGNYDFQPVRVSGCVIDEFQDDVDLNFHILLLAVNNAILPISFSGKDVARLPKFLYSNISLTGVCLPSTSDRRSFHGHGLVAAVSDIVIEKPAPSDLFDAPLLENLHRTDASRVLELSNRRINGTVIAVWRGDRFLLLSDDDRTVIVTIARNSPLPTCDQHVSVSGLPDTDLFNINLISARWKALPSVPKTHRPLQTTLDRLIHGKRPGLKIDPYCHGKSIRFQAKVSGIPRSDFNNARLYVDCGDTTLPVDISACPSAAESLEIGCQVSLSGICVLESDSWRPNTPFPTVHGFVIVIRNTDDVKILSRPSWWTATRLLITTGILITALVVILIWNISLRRLVERRSKELAKSTLAKAKSDLKVAERTRLAMELHDSIAQNLTGVSLAIRGMDYGLAAKTLDSCREDLRNCMWDLRNLALDDGDINAAIRKTLTPHVGSARLAIRFCVPRNCFTDNVTHTILRILRELATNAVRHGKATELRVAGSIEGDKLLFSVSDNGCGFDPASVPGMEDGHFGLQGIRDRVDGFEGDVTIDSAPGRGTKATIALLLPQRESDKP